MEDNKNKALSSAASRYIHLISGTDERSKKLVDNFSSTSQLVENKSKPIDYTSSLNYRHINNDKRNDLMKSFRNILDSTDIIMEDSDRFFKPDTEQVSFMCSHRSQDQSFFSFDGSSHSNTDGFSEGESSNNSIFLSPPKKRFRGCLQSSFFNPSSGEHSRLTESFFKPHTTINRSVDFFENPCIKDITCGSNNFLNTFSDVYKPVPKIQFNLSSSSSMFTAESECFSVNVNDATLMSKFDDAPTERLLSEFDENENSIIEGAKKKPNKLDTFYQVPYIVNAEKIDEFYKNHQFNSWESIKDNITDIMEPSLDYIAYRLKCLKPLMTGSKEENIDFENEDVFNCESINEGIDEIKDSFEKGEFICSTPEEQDSFLPNSNPLNVGFLNLLSDACSTANADAHDEQNDDADKTKSFLINKDQSNVWSALTHVSSSVPVNNSDELNDEPIFDITTIFDYDCPESPLINQKNDPAQENHLKYFDDDDYTRYELLISILNNTNPIDETPLELHETLKIVQNRKAAIMTQIEMLIQALVTSLVNHDSMILKLHKIMDWKDCKYECNVLSQKETAIKIKSLSFTNKNTERTFTIVVHLLGEIYKLLGQNITCTKRELYYRDVELMKSQVSVNKAIDEICALLNVQCWELGVLSTSKGLIAGDLKITTDEDEIIDFSTTNSVPQKPSAIKSMESNAEYVLVVEKDTVFTRLTEDNIMDKIGKKIILITAKGYPDINTRVMLKKIDSELQIPIYIIVDADAFGIDIMCTYKYGSLQMVKFSEQLALPKMEWIGIHPTDIEKLDITCSELTDADLKKVDELIARPYMNKHLENELNHLKNRGFKAEIESIYHYSIDYLIHDYIPQKIATISHPINQIIQESSNFNENLLS